MPVFFDRVKETWTGTGTGTVTLSGVTALGCRAFASVLSDGDACYYVIDDGAGDWEVGLGTYGAAGPTLARTTVLASSTGSAVSFGAGSKDIFLDLPAAWLTRTQAQAGTYDHNQSSPASTWSVAHNLGKYPSVTVIDSGGSVCVGAITYTDADNLTITFSASFSGHAYLN